VRRTAPQDRHCEPLRRFTGSRRTRKKRQKLQQEKTMPNEDPFHLQRFVDAQQTTYTQARAELAAGEKSSHWMWFIFPQIQGLGSSPMAQRYAITDLAEAKAYLAHSMLGARLRECTSLVNAVVGRGLDEIFGYPDDLKFHSSVTLFAEVENTLDSVFKQALTKYFSGRPDRKTLDHLVDESTETN
jgi:uncharacterized protein (DUF1810 family)